MRPCLAADPHGRHTLLQGARGADESTIDYHFALDLIWRLSVNDVQTAGSEAASEMCCVPR